VKRGLIISSIVSTVVVSQPWSVDSPMSLTTGSVLEALMCIHKRLLFSLWSRRMPSRVEKRPFG